MQTLELHNLSISFNGTLPTVPFLAIKEKILGKKYDLSIAFVSPSQAQKLNTEHRNKDYIPNTLSFSLTPTSGEIVLCMSALRAQYREFGMDLVTYVTFIVIHSCLHLKGMEHGSTMESIERRLVKQFTGFSYTHEAFNNRRH
jgi:rRNA maturation RNase YbeY